MKFNSNDHKSKPIPVDVYPMEIVGVSTGVSSKKKTPYVQFKLEILNGSFEGRCIRQDFYITENALWRLGDFCDGFKQGADFDTDDPKGIFAEMAGLRAMVKLKEKGEYEGVMQTEVGGAKPLSSEKRAELSNVPKKAPAEYVKEETSTSGGGGSTSSGGSASSGSSDIPGMSGGSGGVPGSGAGFGGDIPF